jgi:hypothetical protein
MLALSGIEPEPPAGPVLDEAEALEA